MCALLQKTLFYIQKNLAITLQGNVLCMLYIFNLYEEKTVSTKKEDDKNKFNTLEEFQGHLYVRQFHNKKLR